MIRHIIFVFLYVLISCGIAFAKLTPEQETARDKGLELYQQHMGVSAIEPLRIAAEAGDRTAQYYLGETLRLNNMFMTADAQKWYEAAAKQGDLFAMLRLGDSNDLCHSLGTCAEGGPGWWDKALSLAYDRAEKGDTEAMRALYAAGEGLVWLKKAAEAGDSFAQQLLASVYSDGEGWFITTNSRKKEIEKWAKASAEGGFPVGMMWYAGELYEKGDYTKAFEWRKRAAEAGFINGVYAYAKDLLNEEGVFDISPDMVKSYALFSLIARLEGGGGSPEYAQWKVDELRPKLSVVQLEEAEAIAGEWEKSHPPLSYFVPVYGY